MINNIFNKTSILLCASLVSTLLSASSEVKAGLKSNGNLIYNIKQKKVESFMGMFSEAEIYGRLRNNNFYFDYKSPIISQEKNLVGALGASIVYKSASLSGFDFTLGIYGSQAFFNKAELDDISHLKSSKDTLSRFKYINSGSTSLLALGQANISYTVSDTHFRVGRQLVESFYAKSNDTKMIPNTFDGITLHTLDIPDFKISFSYLTKQKLRDHEKGHSVLMYGDDNSIANVTKSQWTQNDDSAMHQGLTYTALKAAGKPTDAPLILLDIQNDSLGALKQNYASYVVPELLAQVMAEFNYKVKIGGVSITPGIRYVQQFDNGAGAVGGASLYSKGLTGNAINLDSYTNPNSLNASMLGLRLVTRFNQYKINLAYTGVADKSDIVTPWRSFITSGYTRSMGMYNWRANVQSYRLELVHGANNKGIYKDGFIQTSLLYMDGDASKEETDSLYYYFGYVKNLKSAPEFQYRLRVGFRDFIGTSEALSSYVDSRFELNYLF